jgi:manganese efflux pump family protein
MAPLEILILGVALAMDAMAVAGARGLAAKHVRPRDALLVAAFFGGAQALMPALGGLAGASFASRVTGWGHWLTFAVFVGLGLKMIYEALGGSDDDDEIGDPFGVKVLAMLAVATSIDALAAGVTLAMRGASLVTACATIGIVTAVLSFVGTFVGHRFGTRAGRRLDVFGGLVLLGLAAKVLIDHFRQG